MILKTVLIKWVDICEVSGWRTLDELDEFISNNKSRVVHQVGFLYEEDESQVTILNSYFPDDDENNTFGSCTVIPRGCILEMFEIKKDYCVRPA